MSRTRLSDPGPAPQGQAAPGAEQPRRRFVDDDAFLLSLRRRESRAIEELCLRHLAKTRLVVLRVLGRDGELDDVVQEVVVRAIGAAPRFRGNVEQVGGWLTAIAVNTARDFIRKRVRFRRFFSTQDDALETVPAHLASIEQIQAVKQTYRVLDKMAPDDRIAFVLRIIEQMTMEQVAEATSVSVSTAKRRVERARRRFDAVAKRDPVLADALGGSQ